MTRKPISPLTPAQIRAGRALLNWSQQQLADASEISLSSVRDYENERRGGEVGGLRAIQKTLENEQVEFLPGDDKGGPGVRLTTRMPTVLHIPNRLVDQGLLIPTEWRGRQVSIVVSREVLEDLGRIPGNRDAREGEHAAVFCDHRAKILNAAATALEAGHITPDGRVYVLSADIPELN